MREFGIFEQELARNLANWWDTAKLTLKQQYLEVAKAAKASMTNSYRQRLARIHAELDLARTVHNYSMVSRQVPAEGDAADSGETPVPISVLTLRKKAATC